jgi:hypothetical protein
MYIVITPTDLENLDIKCEDECGIIVNKKDVEIVVEKLNLNPNYTDFDYDGNLIIIY